MRIFDNFEKNGEIYKDKVCIICGKDKLTYHELINSIRDKAERLCGSFEKGEKVIIKLSNPIMQVVTFLACAKAGLISIVVHSELKKDLLDNIVKKTEASCIIHDNFSIGKNKRMIPNVSKDDIFLGALSSGTTGEHKVIWRDHKSWASAFPHQSRIFSINSSDTLFLAGSLGYTANLNSVLHILNEGGAVVFSKNSYPRTWIKEIIGNDVTTLFMVPSHYRILVRSVEKPLFRIKSILSAGEKLDKKTVIAMQKVFPNTNICEYYGASELGHITYIKGDEILKSDSVGRAFPEVKLWIEDDKIWVESPYIAPEFRTKATVGDRGELDDKGYLYLQGRENDTINKGGVKVLPSQIERVLNSHPKIHEAVVIGIDHPLKGEEVVALIVKKVSELTFQEIIEYCRKNLEKHSCPQKIKFVDNITLNSSGKIDKKVLTELFTNHD